VIFCNFENDIRAKNSGEISHLIVIKTNKSGTLYCYIELFNIICAYIKLVENFGDEINFVYYQDAVTTKRLKDEILLNLENEPTVKSPVQNFGHLIASAFESIRERAFLKILNEKITEIGKQALLELENGNLSEDRFEMEVLNRRIKVVAELTFEKFPYLVDEFKDEENDMLNYHHSNMREENFDWFCKAHKEWIGIKVTFPENEIFHIDSFFKRPFIERNGIKLVKVYCVMVQNSTNLKRYIPYREFFEGIVLPNDLDNK
jgi:hypothetical protein